jgi:hypothetical protein
MRWKGNVASMGKLRRKEPTRKTKMDDRGTRWGGMK